MTNKERIQSMNSNELAGLLRDVLNAHAHFACYRCPLKDVRTFFRCGNSIHSEDGILCWLNAEVKTHE